MSNHKINVVYKSDPSIEVFFKPEPINIFYKPDYILKVFCSPDVIMLLINLNRKVKLEYIVTTGTKKGRGKQWERIPDIFTKWHYRKSTELITCIRDHASWKDMDL
jgi:hypothetical protein